MPRPLVRHVMQQLYGECLAGVNPSKIDFYAHFLVYDVRSAPKNREFIPQTLQAYFVLTLCIIDKSFPSGVFPGC